MYQQDNLLILRNDLSKISNILNRFKQYYSLTALVSYMSSDNMQFKTNPIAKCAEGTAGVNEFFDYYDDLLDKFEQLNKN